MSSQVDSVSYYARAHDDSGGQSEPVSSDLYFLRIRPFQRDFRQAQSQGGGGGGGGGQVEALSEQQRQIISATFNVQRDCRSFNCGAASREYDGCRSLPVEASRAG